MEVKTYGHIGDLGDTVFLGDYKISLEDFLCAAEYVLTNTNLEDKDDPRLKFVERIKKMKVARGWNDRGKRLGIKK